jgi:hypothetical protein
MAAPATSSYRRVINHLGLSGNSQDNGGDMAYLVLAVADLLNASTAADVYADPRKEVLHRLDSLKGSVGYRRLAELFGDI